MPAQFVIVETTSSQDHAQESRVIAVGLSSLDVAGTRARAYAHAGQVPSAHPTFSIHVQRSGGDAPARTSRGHVQRLAAGTTYRLWYGARTGYHLEWQRDLAAGGMTRLTLAQVAMHAPEAGLDLPEWEASQAPEVLPLDL